jgi:tartrate-resistant acid phosphatase type 5
MKKIQFFLVLFASILVLVSCNNQQTKSTKTDLPNADTLSVITTETFRKAFNIIIVSDWGRNGYNNQQEVATQMAKTGVSIDPEFIASCGDNFQINGVSSVQDPLWQVNFENIYKGNSLQADWFPVLGNHDYRGNTQAQIDYSKISRRWRMIDRNYTFTRKINDSISARFIFIDTPSLIDEYRKNTEEFPDAIKQNADKEILWLKDVLANSKEQWKIVFGHHPVYSASHKHGNTREMISRVKPLLEQYNVQFYICGHDHDFQHLREKNGKVDYIVTGTGSETRPSSTNEMSLFNRSEPGFSVMSLKTDSLRLCFVGTTGNILYSFVRSYR